MDTCSNAIISTTFTVPHCAKDNEESLNKHNRCLVEKVKKSNVPFNIIKISKNKLEKLLENEVTLQICHKSSFQENNFRSRRHEHLNLKKDWHRIPQEVRDEVLKSSKQKKSRKCEKNCSCKYSRELIQLYHNAQMLREKAEKLEQTRNEERLEINKIKELETTKCEEKLETIKNPEKLEINKNDDFFKNISLPNVLMTGINNQNLSVKKLRNLSANVKEKLKIHEESNLRNENHFTDLKKRVQQIQKIIHNFQPQGKIFQLKNEQQTIDIAFMNRSLFMEEDNLRKAEEEIQTRLKCKEDWIKQDESYDLERTKQRRIDTLLALKSINLMENYIEELKFQV